MNLKKHPLGNIYHTFLNELYDSTLDKTHPIYLDEKNNINCVFDTKARFHTRRGALMYLTFIDGIYNYRFYFLRIDRVWEISNCIKLSESFEYVENEIKYPLSNNIYSKMLYIIMFRIYLYLIKNKIIQPG